MLSGYPLYSKVKEEEVRTRGPSADDKIVARLAFELEDELQDEIGGGVENVNPIEVQEQLLLDVNKNLKKKKASKKKKKTKDERKERLDEEEESNKQELPANESTLQNIIFEDVLPKMPKEEPIKFDISKLIFQNSLCQKKK